MIPSLRFVLIVCLLSTGPAAATDWPHLRGPAYDGRADGGGMFDAEDLALKLAWRVPLGSAYSGIAVAGGKVVTMDSNADGDWLVALNAETGQTEWRHRMGDTTKGLDGADDGPLSTPVVADGRVHALGSQGMLVTVGLADGEAIWDRQITETFAATPPDFGFTTTPLVDGELLILQAGGKDGKSLVALDRKTGEMRWTHGDGQVAYQSPVMMTLAGRRQIVAVDAAGIVGLAPGNGEVLWKQALGEGVRAGSANPTSIGDDRFVMLTSGGAAAYRVTHSEGEFDVEALYVSDVLGRNYAPPVYHDGHLYGFRGQLLNCMNAETGERVWRSRPPGGDGLILVDGHLVIFASEGNVVVAEASPAGYRERARFEALGSSGFTWPSFARGRIFVRNLEELSAVSISRSEAAQPAAERTEAPARLE